MRLGFRFIKNAVLGITTLGLSWGLAFAEVHNNPVRLCTDEAYWYPFTMVKDGEPTGVHVDLASTALKNLGYEVNFIAMPWRRCLKENENGSVDGVISASYKDERAEYLVFPNDAATTSKSSLRIMQIEYSVVTLERQNFRFSGDVSTLPAPVRVPAGYSIASELKQQGVVVDDASMSDVANIRKLLRDKKGSVVVIPELASLMNAQVGVRHALTISDTPLRSKSYYLAFSKLSRLSYDEMEKIWQRIAELRDNQPFMAELIEKY